MSNPHACEINGQNRYCRRIINTIMNTIVGRNNSVAKVITVYQGSAAVCDRKVIAGEWDSRCIQLDKI